MSLVYKVIPDIQRSMYIYYPNAPIRTWYRRCSIMILRNTSSKISAENIMKEYNLWELAEKEELIIAFPNPVKGGWNYSLEADGEDDVKAIIRMQQEVVSPNNETMELDHRGRPTNEFFMRQWHLMNDTRYFIGFDKGASMLYTLIALHPDHIAAAILEGGKLSDQAFEKKVNSPVPAHLFLSQKNGEEYLVNANEAELYDTNQRCRIYQNSTNSLQSVCIHQETHRLTAELLHNIYDTLFKKVRRSDTGEHGDIEPRMDLAKVGFELFLDDKRLGDNNGMAHTWLVKSPESIKNETYLKIPMIIFMHGASDNPAEAADMCKFHELGEKEGFITVYPWSSNKVTWNSDMEDELDDVAYIKALIEYMIKCYPVDSSRVYLSGFSNGAAQAQVFAMLHPEMIAAICHIDSNWPGKRKGISEINHESYKAFTMGMEKKKRYDYRMPVWYTYGTREPCYPIIHGSNQQIQYDFWKLYNNIEVKPTPNQGELNPGGCGVVGEQQEMITPSPKHKHHSYHINRFYSKDNIPRNYYNYVIMHDKGHEVAEMDPILGWNYVKQFRRNSDGSVEYVLESNQDNNLITKT